MFPDTASYMKNAWTFLLSSHIELQPQGRTGDLNTPLGLSHLQDNCPGTQHAQVPKATKAMEPSPPKIWRKMKEFIF